MLLYGLLVGLLVHHFGPGWINYQMYCHEFHGPRRMNPTDFDDAIIYLFLTSNTTISLTFVFLSNMSWELWDGTLVGPYLLDTHVSRRINVQFVQFTNNLQ